MYRTVITVPVIFRVKKRFVATSVEIIQWLRGSMNTKHLIWMLSHTRLSLYMIHILSAFTHMREMPAGIFIKTVELIRKTDFPRTIKKLQTSPPWPSLPVLSIQARGLSPLPPFGWVEAKLLPPLLLPPNTYLPSSWRHQPWYKFYLQPCFKLS